VPSHGERDQLIWLIFFLKDFFTCIMLWVDWLDDSTPSPQIPISERLKDWSVEECP
jgi:hypothetical protein